MEIDVFERDDPLLAAKLLRDLSEANQWNLPILEAVPQLQRQVGIHIVAGQRVGLAAADPEKSPGGAESRIEVPRIENPGHKRFSVRVHEPLGRPRHGAAKSAPTMRIFG
jgi:hypothetical protein